MKVDDFLAELSEIKRPGIIELSNYLVNDTDFFKAPASTRNHHSYFGGLWHHSLQVYQCLLTIEDSFILKHKKVTLYPIETLRIVGLLHDVCKANFYEQTLRNVKRNGNWIQEPYFTVNDKFPIGHGEKSVIVIQRYMTLTADEIMAIRWHMGGFDDSTYGYGGLQSLGAALNMCPLVTSLHMADLASSYLLSFQ